MIKRYFLAIILYLCAFNMQAQEPGFAIKFYLKNNNDTIWVSNPDYKVTAESYDKDNKMHETMDYFEQGKDLFKYTVYGGTYPSKQYHLTITRLSKKEVMNIEFHSDFDQKTLQFEVSLGTIMFTKGTYEFTISKDVPPTEYGYKVPVQSAWKKKQ